MCYSKAAEAAVVLTFPLKPFLAIKARQVAQICYQEGQNKLVKMGRYTGKKCRLMAMFSLTASFFLVEIIVGHVTNSMALIADSFHMLSDIAALVIAFISVKMAPKSWDKNTYGWARAEVLGKTKVFFSISIEDSEKAFSCFIRD